MLQRPRRARLTGSHPSRRFAWLVHSHRVLLMILLVLTLAACGGDDPDDKPDSPAPAADSEGVPTGAGATATVPPPTDVPPTPAIPTPDYTSGTPHPIENFTLPGDWRVGAFDTPDGARHRLIDFDGRGVILHLMSATCERCAEQHLNLLRAADELRRIDYLPDTVFVALGISPLEPPTLITNMLQTQLGDDWSLVTALRDDPAADWMAGVATDQLVRHLTSAFGSAVTDTSQHVLIVIEPNGLAHLLADPGYFDTRTLREVIEFYGNPPAGE